MSVIINEFEVVVDDRMQDSGPEQAANASQQAAPPTLTPKDIGDILRHRAARLARLRAH